MEIQKVYYTLEEVRNMVFSNNISKTTMRKLAIEKKIPTVQIFSKRFVPKYWVEKALEKALYAPDTEKEGNTI